MFGNRLRICSLLLKSKFNKSNLYFFGSDEISISCLQQIVHSNNGRFNIECITYNQKAKHEKNLIEEYCRTNQINCWSQITRTNKEQDFLALTEKIKQQQQNNDVDLGIVCSFGFMIPCHLIEQIGRQFIVVHPSLLPKYRGAAPLYHVLLNGDRQTGVSLIQISRNQFDAGAILMQNQFEVNWDETYGQLLAKVRQQVQNIIGQFMDQGLEKSFGQMVDQKDEEMSSANKLFKNDTFVDWNSTTAQIYNQFRAFHGSNLLGARCRYQGYEVIFIDVYQTSQKQSYILDQIFKDAQIGSIQIQTNKQKSLTVKTGQGWIGVRKIKVNGQLLSARQFLAKFGLQKKVGEDGGLQKEENGKWIFE